MEHLLEDIEFCNDCGRQCGYCYDCEDYFHLEAQTFCWLIRRDHKEVIDSTDLSGSLRSASEGR
jgi:hypothetical protein